MQRFIPKFYPQTGLKYVLVVQLTMAGLLIATHIFEMFPRLFREQVEMPSGPVSPGDQRREYRTDRPVPDLVTLKGPVELPMPEKFPDRLRFEEIVVEGAGNVLLVTGQIENGDASRFQIYLSGMSQVPDLVALHSPGGLVSEALQIGRHIRDNGMSSTVLAGAFCVSSCPYILAGGEERIVSRRGIVGLHQHYYEQPKYLPVIFAVESIQMGQGQTMEYLIEMGVDPSLMVYSLKTPPEQIYALVEEELTETRIATEVVD
ncbi:hypothetical protein SAMN05444414_102210 [Roseovarius marisflavi]|uniref:Clp protease n=1 Tax=Roseovarius marisflavi TaxID=1054996 RepID=A0A1M6WAF5_9RHOB|nr:hypothetical protein [Roseovarius marisflavi]SHK90677.1 hypothetical protein SAMN05444414_102210 [Roseovarius marisflavi]